MVQLYTMVYQTAKIFRHMPCEVAAFSLNGKYDMSIAGLVDCSGCTVTGQRPYKKPLIWG